MVDGASRPAQEGTKIQSTEMSTQQPEPSVRDLMTEIAKLRNENQQLRTRILDLELRQETSTLAELERPSSATEISEDLEIPNWFKPILQRLNTLSVDMQILQRERTAPVSRVIPTPTAETTTEPTRSYAGALKQGTRQNTPAQNAPRPVKSAKDVAAAFPEQTRKGVEGLAALSKRLQTPPPPKAHLKAEVTEKMRLLHFDGVQYTRTGVLWKLLKSARFQLTKIHSIMWVAKVGLEVLVHENYATRFIRRFTSIVQGSSYLPAVGPSADFTTESSADNGANQATEKVAKGKESIRSFAKRNAVIQADTTRPLQARKFFAAVAEELARTVAGDTAQLLCPTSATPESVEIQASTPDSLAALSQSRSQAQLQPQSQSQSRSQSPLHSNVCPLSSPVTAPDVTLE